jgi:hypothetical protein
MKAGLLPRSKILTPFLALGFCVSAFACTIPVFRFALDRWEADRFRLLTPASWATKPDMVRLLIPLRGNGEANIRIEDNPDASATETKLLFPHANTPVWSGTLDAATLPPLLDSPARRELLQRILSGDSVIWVVCTKEADKSEADRVEKRLRYLEKVAALPPQDPDDPDSQLGPGPPLKLKFSVIRVSLDDPAEKIFAAMVAGPKQQELIAKGTSFAGPIFAKGRVLGSWALAELDDTAIEDATLFLIGRCSCRIKNENPGWDVVLKTDWEHALAKAGDAAAENTAELAPPTTSDARPATPEAQRLNERVKALETYVASGTSPAVVPSLVATSPTAGFKMWVRSIAPIVGAAALTIVSVIAGLMLWFKR